MDMNVIITLVIVGVIAAVVVSWYVARNMRISKGDFGKKTVRNILSRYAGTRKYKLLENVQLELDGKTQTIDFVLVGYFGLIFVSALQGKGDFYGDFDKARWTFIDDEHMTKVSFDNPVIEMDKKLELFRRIMAQKKVYNLKVDTAIVVVSSKSDVPMYLSHVRSDNNVMTVSQFRRMLANEKYEQDNKVNIEEVCAILENRR